MKNKKEDTKYHEILKQASIYAYRKDNSKPPAGYKVIDSVDNKNNGFHAEVLSNGKDMIIAYRGTEPTTREDIRNDIAMARNRLPAQATDAIAVYDKVARENPGMDISVTGHSLGGSLGEIVSGIRGVFAATFNAYGVRDMFKSGIKLKENNVINYVNEKDYIAMVNGQSHIGEIYAVPEKPGSANSHEAESMEDLSQRKIRTTEEIKQTSKNLHPNMTKVKELISGETAGNLKNNIRQKMGDLKSSIDKKLGRKDKDKGGSTGSQCVGSYTVSGYTRSDGTKVGDYVRTCGAKHGS